MNLVQKLCNSECWELNMKLCNEMEKAMGRSFVVAEHNVGLFNEIGQWLYVSGQK